MKIVEVGPRDGLQNETAAIPSELKVAFIDALSESGVDEIEVTAFVSPRWLPQLSDGDAVFRDISRSDGVVYSALVPNEKGLDRAVASRVDKVAIFTSASETFNQKNINTSIEGSLKRFQPVVRRARQEGIAVRGYVSAAFWCAFEGRIHPEAVLDVTERLVEMGVDEVSISDTIGKASLQEVAQLLDLLLRRLDADRIAMHFHDTYGRAVQNVLYSWSQGIRTFDSSVGGLGGCPYAPGATGNVATEDVVTALTENGIPVGINLPRLAKARRLLDPFLKEDRRTRPAADSLACETCEFNRGEDCCHQHD